MPPLSAQVSRSEESTASPDSFGPAAFLQSEGHVYRARMEGRACHARGSGMGDPTLCGGRDERVPPKDGPDKRVPPRGGYRRLSTLGHWHKLDRELILAGLNLHLLFLGN